MAALSHELWKNSYNLQKKTREIQIRKNHIFDNQSLHHICSSVLKNFHTWTLDDHEEESWNSTAINIYGIFKSCHETWDEIRKLWQPCQIKEVMEFGVDLFRILCEIFNECFDGLIDFILLDAHFDHIELILSLNCLFKSTLFYKLFEETLKSIISEVANKGLELKDENEKLKEFYMELADSNDKTDFIAEKLIDNFCKKQREVFLDFIKVHFLFKISFGKVL